MAEAKRDGNSVPTLLAVSNVDGTTPVVLYADPTTHRLLVSATSGSLDDLTDVTITSVAQGDILYYNGSAWVNLAAGTSGRFLKTQGAAANPIWADVTATTTTNVTVADEAADTSCFVLFVTAATGDLPPKSNAGLTFNSSTGVVTATGFSGPLTGNVTGNASGTAATVTGSAQAAITTLANLTSVQGLTVTLADAGADAILGWDDSAAAYENLTQAEVLAIIGDSSETAKGVVELATDAETVTGTDTARATTPANITAKMAAPGTIGGTTPGNITGLVITANTSFMPDANDGAVLGAAATAFSDLYLASGALIGFANGDAVITHSSGVIGVTTGDLRVTTAGTNSASVVTVGGTQTLTSKTLTSPAITTATLTGAQLLAEGASLALDAASSADGAFCGITRAGTAGATLAFGDLVYLAAADSRWELADADAASTSGDVVLGMCVLAAAADGDPTTLLFYGIIRADAAFPAMTIGGPMYVGTTAGDIQTAQPSGTDDVIRRVGFAWTADELFFNPSNDYITHT